jgi:hypothetical protein
LTCTSGCPVVAGTHHWQPRLMARRFWWRWCAHGSGGCRAVPYARAWEPRIIGIDPRSVARRAPGGPPKAEPGADTGPAAPPRFHIRLDSAVDQVRAVRTPSERSRRSHRPIPNALPHRRTRVPFRRCRAERAPGCICRICRVTTHGRALRADGPELDDMNAVITAGRSSWRALIFDLLTRRSRSDITPRDGGGCPRRAGSRSSSCSCRCG